MGRCGSTLANMTSKSSSQRLNTNWFKAVKDGNIMALRQSITQGVDINSKDFVSDS